MTFVPLDAYRPEWWVWAACRGDGPERWVLTRGGGDTRRQLVQLRRVCAGCPTTAECLQAAFAAGQTGLERRLGPVRCGTTGDHWGAVERLVRELEPVTLAQWGVVAASVV